MHERAIKIFIIVILGLAVIIPAYCFSLSNNQPDIELLNSLNTSASNYFEKTKTSPQKFTDFVEFDPLMSSESQILNIYSYYNDLDQQKHFKGYDTNRMTIHFKNGKKVTYLLINGHVIIDNI